MAASATGVFGVATRFFRGLRMGPMAAAPAGSVTWRARLRLDYLNALPRAHVGGARTLYRGDGRSADVVFTEGFRPSSGHGRVVFASPRWLTARRTPRGMGNVYRIRAPGGSRASGQLRSVEFLEGIDTRYIEGLMTPDGKQIARANANFRPS